MQARHETEGWSAPNQATPCKIRNRIPLWEMKKPGGGVSTGPKSVRPSLLGLLRLVGLRVGRNGGWSLVAAVAHQVRHERRDFEGHLLALRHRSHRLALKHFQMVVPRVKHTATA